VNVCERNQSDSWWFRCDRRGRVSSVNLFEGFRQDYEESMKPKEYEVEHETPAECMARVDRLREYLKKSMDRVRDNQRDLSHGKKETENEAHRDYLENYYARQMEELENRYCEATQETCEGGA